MAKPERPSDPASTHHEDMKPGSPPRHATEPATGRPTPSNNETQTDPVTGEPKD